MILETDSYKLTHWPVYPDKTEKIFSYFESRGGDFPMLLFYGLQIKLMESLQGVVLTKEMIDEAEELAEAHLGKKGVFNRKGWEYILRVHGGKLPVVIKAVPEGTVLPTHNVLMTIENTDPNCFWLTNALETMLVQTWYPLTVATQSMFLKRLILRFLEETGDPSLIDFKLHDFGERGSPTMETAGVGGSAHLVNFKGTDTIEGLRVHRRNYGEKMAGFSIPATEHSVMTALGRDGEAEQMKRMLIKFPAGTISVVSDSYDIFNACEHIWGEQLRDMVFERDGTVVVRLDSGDPVTVVLRSLEILGRKFGATTNEKGYKVLDPHVRIIQGDGVNYDSIEKILMAMKVNGWSADNIAFGMGGALLQKVNRDTLKMAFKCSSDVIDGVQHDVFKQPITDPGKNSKAGRLKLILRDGKYRTVKEDEPEEDKLVEVFRDGEIKRYYTLAEIRERAKDGLEKLIRMERESDGVERLATED
ncbi:MAG: nicotinate phosphoribosyltransferase [Candidatus Marsarchaeota archaeon]|nr:nicotinate phosphoribosyltransferase [Candidatus Marsarchaeota archaeon]